MAEGLTNRRKRKENGRDEVVLVILGSCHVSDNCCHNRNLDNRHYRCRWLHLPPPKEPSLRRGRPPARTETSLSSKVKPVPGLAINPCPKERRNTCHLIDSSLPCPTEFRLRIRSVQSSSPETARLHFCQEPSKTSSIIYSN